MHPTRRSLLTAILTLPPVLALGRLPALAAAGRLEPTPACGEDPDITPAQTEGPFYRLAASP